MGARGGRSKGQTRAQDLLLPRPQPALLWGSRPVNDAYHHTGQTRRSHVMPPSAAPLSYPVSPKKPPSLPPEHLSRPPPSHLDGRHAAATFRSSAATSSLALGVPRDLSPTLQPLCLKCKIASHYSEIKPTLSHGREQVRFGACPILGLPAPRSPLPFQPLWTLSRVCPLLCPHEPLPVRPCCREGPPLPALLVNHAQPSDLSSLGISSRKSALASAVRSALPY